MNLNTLGNKPKEPIILRTFNFKYQMSRREKHEENRIIK